MMSGHHQTSMFPHSQATPAPGGGTFLNEKIPANILATPLFDAAGKSFTLGSLAGRSVVLTNFLTSCHEICPMTTANMRDVGDAVAKAKANSRISVVELSVDAGRDSAPRLAAYQNLFGDTSWTLASGTEKNLNAIWTYFGAPATKNPYSAKDVTELPRDWLTGKPDTYDMTHADLVVVIGPDSTWRWLDLGSPKSNGVIPGKLKAYLSEDGLHNLAQPEEPTWTVSAVLSALKEITGVALSA
jgi:cytochrome oxidase Cu insertion factor (SCO1/SenC/PrrC family)